MEKGAHSTFKATYNRLRHQWVLDDPRGAAGTASPALSGPGAGPSGAHAMVNAVRLVPSPMPSPNLGAPRSPMLS